MATVPANPSASSTTTWVEVDDDVYRRIVESKGLPAEFTTSTHSTSEPRGQSENRRSSLEDVWRRHVVRLYPSLSCACLCF